MSGFYYFLPDESATNLTVPKKWLSARDRHGLADVLSDVRLPTQFVGSDVVRNGPGGKSGVVIAARRNDGEEPKSLGYFPDKQTWAPTFGSAWIGYETLPRPEWLRRATPEVGQVRTDASGRSWLIPVARMPDATYGTLPKQYEFDERGNAKPTIRLDAVALWELSGRVWDALNDVEGRAMSMAEFAAAACKALAWNYRIGPTELNAFGKAGEPIIDDATTGMFCMSLIHNDVAALRGSNDLKNDETPTGSASLPGSMDETTAGAQVAAS